MTAAVAAAAGGSGGGGGAYVIRLDTIPTFNPQMIGGVPIEEVSGREGEVGFQKMCMRTMNYVGFDLFRISIRKQSLSVWSEMEIMMSSLAG